ncbi:hypothetical protein [Ferrimonas pelagia]|uniref:Uncharacterized protein n=1 Tax=Ferrimonas pelagia TaxID=1177826 RepID=A0ABP9E976_9GAMM
MIYQALAVITILIITTILAFVFKAFADSAASMLLVYGVGLVIAEQAWSNLEPNP